MEDYTEEQVTINGIAVPVPHQEAPNKTDFENERESDLNLLAIYGVKYYMAIRGKADITEEEFRQIVEPALIRQGELIKNFIDLEQ